MMCCRIGARKSFSSRSMPHIYSSGTGILPLALPADAEMRLRCLGCAAGRLTIFCAFSDLVRIALAISLNFPLGFVMGMPFPFAMRNVWALERTLVPWAWTVNACASVASAVLATLLAIHIGFTLVLVFAATQYVLAAWLYPGGISATESREWAR